MNHNKQAAEDADFLTDNLADVSSSTLASSLNFLNCETDDSLTFFMSDDSIFIDPEPSPTDQLEKISLCGCTGSIRSSSSRLGSSRLGKAGYNDTEISQNSQCSSRHMIPSKTGITLHSTPISTPVKSPSGFHFEMGYTPEKNNDDIYFSLNSTNSKGTFDTEFNESSDNSLFLQEPTQSAEPLATSGHREASKIKLAEIAQPGCCHQYCLLHMTSFEISSTLEHFNSKNVVEQNQFLLDSFRATFNKETIYHMLCGKHICKDAYIKILQISKKRYNNILTLLKANPTVKIARKCVFRSESIKVIEAKAWMERYFKRIGDSMPHTDRIHLPHGLTKRDIYYNMKSQLQEQGLNNIISLSHFYSLWKSSFEKVAIPKHNLFSKCDICTKYNKERLLLSKDRLQQLKCKYELHLKNVEQERAKYHHHREKSRSQPTKYLTIIIDGMDQNKTNIPNLFRTPKALQAAFKLQTHCTGVLAHTRAPKGKKVYAFYDICQWPQDTNITIHALLNVLLDFTEHLPEVLYLQLDNAGNQNKNRYLLGFCAFLVEKRVFNKININFLPVGHTHEDVDQFFSRIALQLRKSGAESLPDLLHATNISMEPNPMTFLIDTMYDIKSWIIPHLNELHGHRDPHCFKFELNEHSKSVMYFRNWTTDAWCSEDQATVILRSMPDGIPQFVVPSLVKVEPEKLQDSIPKFKSWISSTAWGHWEDFLENHLPKLGDIPADCNKGFCWPVPVLQASSGRRMQVITCTATEENNHADDGQVLEEMLDEERVPVEVYTGSYRRPGSTSRRVLDVEDVCSLEEGQLVALNVINCSLRPLLGKITKVHRCDLDIIWLDGSYSRPWKIAKRKEGRTIVDWTDTVPKSAVILFDFELTSTNRLRKATIQHLKDTYSNLDS